MIFAAVPSSRCTSSVKFSRLPFKFVSFWLPVKNVNVLTFSNGSWNPTLCVDLLWLNYCIILDSFYLFNHFSWCREFNSSYIVYIGSKIKFNLLNLTEFNGESDLHYVVYIGGKIKFNLLNLFEFGGLITRSFISSIYFNSTY